MPAPYGFLVAAQAVGRAGGYLDDAGLRRALALLKLRADPNLGAAKVLGRRDGVHRACCSSWRSTGLALYAATGTGAVPLLLALHLGSVLAFFLLTPFTKMAHGFYRLTALIKDQTRA